eukprot:CAMPEP_0176009840 /NCGR_PEP_ID=MMETSP0120_2-20121206/4458_1 /TAXON_ID=160619 /ORGANISM="Kryptoperidinium foliaceum, Strain CCMP 1326" /LENGTH=201 /DNA_ID=CAMNT_0017342649 /DNA_START=216 /DNA_END=818 /DNA_ORIENTATION=+
MGRHRSTWWMGFTNTIRITSSSHQKTKSSETTPSSEEAYLESKEDPLKETFRTVMLEEEEEDDDSSSAIASSCPRIDSEQTSLTAVSSTLSLVALDDDKRRVRFGGVSVRTFPQILGDHPYCSMGCPLELDWQYSKEEEESLPLKDDDETTTLCPKLTPEERLAILQASTTPSQLRKACRRKSRHNSKSYRRKLCNEFFVS